MTKFKALLVAMLFTAFAYLCINLYIYGFDTNFLGLLIVSPITTLVVTGPVALGLGAKDPVRTSAAIALVAWGVAATVGAYFFGLSYSAFDIMMGGATMVIIGAMSGIGYKGVVG